jgi:CRP-like cAMP-binding protein
MTEIVGSSAIVNFVRRADSGSRLMSYYSDDAIFEPKTAATEFFVVESGEIRLFEVAAGGARRLLDILGPGRCFGFASLGRMPFCEKLAVSVGQSTVWAISADRLREIFLHHGELALEFVESMARQVHDAWLQGSHFVFEDCRFRLIETLLRFKDSPAARTVPDGIELRMTHAQLAQSVGVARETISLCLMELRRENLVQTSRSRVTYSPDRLRQYEAPPAFIPPLAIAG